MESNEFLCTLEERFLCPKRLENKKCSDSNAVCGFAKQIVVETKEPEPKPYVRKERWYEQYYNGTAKKDKWITNRFE